MSRSIRWLIAAGTIATIGLPAAAQAQELRGLVRDSASARPIPGVVLMLLDANGRVLGRNITNERGEYRVALSTEMRRLRIIRIGFRPKEGLIPALENGVARLDLSMQSLPTMLEPVRVSAGARCPKRSDSQAAFALLEQARAGLLATVVARDANPGTLLRLGFDRTMDEDRVVSQKVRMDSAVGSARPFASVRDAAVFVSQGFMLDSAGVQTFYGPDADVLLDAGFTDGYCFRIADGNRARTTQVGLTFFAASRKRARIDVEGTLWVDTVARALRDVEYRYVGLDPRLNSVRPGGHIWFREMPNGVVLIDRWNIRLPTSETETIQVGSREELRQWFSPIENGGELARATWPDGSTWHASLGSMLGEARMADGAPAAGALLHLRDTHYRATVDSSGHFQFSYLLPGPYTFAVVDSGLASLGLEIPLADTVRAVRDSVLHPSIVTWSARSFIADRCVADRRFSPGDSPYIIGRVFAPDGASVDGLSVNLLETSPQGETRALPDIYRLGTNGIFEWCQTLTLGRTITVQVHQRGSLVGSTQIRLTEKITYVKLLVTPVVR